MSSHRRAVRLLVLLLLGAAPRVGAEDIFLAKQYTNCTTCHYSPTGGGLVTPYGRKLWRQEIATFGRTDPAQEAAEGRFREEEFLGGLLGDRLKPLDLGILARPARLHYEFGGVKRDRSFWMDLALQAAWRAKGWTAYGEIDREPTANGHKISSYEYWVGHQAESGLGLRVGRFLPAYGIRDWDHTAYIRRDLGFDRNGQVYAVEVSDTTEHQLVQFSIGPGRAESILHDDGQRALTMTGRFQTELGTRSVLVLSGMYKGSSRQNPMSFFGGVSWGFAPTRRLVFWQELDERISDPGFHGTPAYTLYQETSFEVLRGVWLKFSPQLRTDLENVDTGSVRLALGLELFPRTHWTLGLNVYRDRDRASDFVFKTLLLQLQIYL